MIEASITPFTPTQHHSLTRGFSVTSQQINKWWSRRQDRQFRKRVCREILKAVKGTPGVTAPQLYTQLTEAPEPQKFFEIFNGLCLQGKLAQVRVTDYLQGGSLIAVYPKGHSLLKGAMPLYTTQKDRKVLRGGE